MRRALAALLTCLIVIGGACPGAHAAEVKETPAPDTKDAKTAFTSGYAEVKTGKGTLNMRAKANDKASVVAKLANGWVVKVLEAGEEWTKVSYTAQSGAEKAGYVKTSFLTESQGPPPDEKKDAEPAPSAKNSGAPTDEDETSGGDLDEEAEDAEAGSDEAGESEDDENAGGEGGIGSAADLRFAEIATPKGTLNMRRQAKSGAKVAAKLPNGSVVQVLESGEKWTKVSFGARTGFVMTAYLTALKDLPYKRLEPGDKGEEVQALKKRLRELGYLESKQVNQRYDGDLEKAIRKLELLSGLLQTGIATPELQAFVFWGKVTKSKSGSGASNTDEGSGLSASIFGWTSGYIPIEGTDSVEVSIHYVTQASGGTGPYTVTVKRTANYEDSSASGESVKNPFKVAWRYGMSAVFLTVIVEDAAGNRVSAKARIGIQTTPGYDGAID